MKIKNLTLIGTSHIAAQSLQEVKKTIERLQPKVVAVELDRGRAQALLSGKREGVRLSDIRRVGLKGFLFAWLGSFAERKLGEMVGVKPGEEMIVAIREAQRIGALVALVDQQIEITLKRFSKTLSWKERWRMVVDVIKAVIFRRPIVAFDLRTVPDEQVIKKLTGELKKRYPNIYKVLILERNVVIARRLIALMRAHPEDQIVAVLGAGHIDDVARRIKKAFKHEER